MRRLAHFSSIHSGPAPHRRQCGRFENIRERLLLGDVGFLVAPDTSATVDAGTTVFARFMGHALFPVHTV